ncbi:hypothetical protein ACW9I4_00185 [Pseudomonas sp. SDT2931_S440]|nr:MULTISPECIES: hypothetical protein [Pseudomonas]WLH32680.1 hypothetical protein PSH56_13425 [Pseudomonas canadensis]
MKNTKGKLTVTGKMTEGGANVAGVMLAFGAMALMIGGAAALVLHAIH